MSILQGRVAVITGAESGIGRALAESLFARGCGLALVDRDLMGLEKTARRLGSTDGRVSITSAIHIVPEFYPAGCR